MKWNTWMKFTSSPPPVWSVLPCTSLSGTVMAVDELRLEHRGNEKSACYGAVMVYSTLAACPMGLLSSSQHIPFSTILQHRVETPPNCVLTDGKRKLRARDEGWRTQEVKRKTRKGSDVTESLLSWVNLWLPRKPALNTACTEKHTYALTHLHVDAHRLCCVPGYTRCVLSLPSLHPVTRLVSIMQLSSDGCSCSWDESWKHQPSHK